MRKNLPTGRHITGLTVNDGLGFGMKWMMGWMHDTINYFKMDPIFRKDHQDKFTFSMMYFYDENFMLPLSHDEVVHGKSPMIYKMPGDEWQKFANLDCYTLICIRIPGVNFFLWEMNLGKLLNGIINTELDWHLLVHEPHQKMQDCVSAA